MRNPKKRLLQAARNRAKNKNLPFNLTEIDIIIPEFCPVLGIKIDCGLSKRAPNSPSMDRFKPHLGYVPKNINIISYKANQIKNDGTAEEHEMIAKWMRKNEYLNNCI